MTSALPFGIRPTTGEIVEACLAATILLGIGYCITHALLYGYLPPPFFFEPSDTFADWFNTAYWAQRNDAYETWGTIYPPLSFVVMRILGIERCYPTTRPFDGSAGLDARDCDWLGLSSIAVLFVGNIALTWWTLRKIDPRTAPMRTICVALGMPMLNGLERGNLLLLAYPCVLLAFGPLLASARLRWVFAGLAINLKVYLVGAAFALLLRKRWLWVEGALIAVVAVYLVSFAMYGSGTPIEIVTNIRLYSETGQPQILDLWHSMTFQALGAILETGSFPLSTIIGSVWVNRLEFLLPVLTRGTQLLGLAAAAAIWLRPHLFTSYRAIGLAILIAMVTAESGMYTQIFFVVFILMEPWRGFCRKWCIVMCYVLAFPFDIPIDYLPEGVRYSYIAGTNVSVVNQVTLMPLIRPLLVMTLVWALALTTFHELLRDLYRPRTNAIPAAADLASPQLIG